MCRARRSAQNVGAERERPCAAVCNFQLQIMIPHPGKPRTIFPSPPVFMLPRQNRGKTTVIHGKTAANLLELSRRTASGGVVEVLSRAAEPEVLGVIPKSTHAENFLK